MSLTETLRVMRPSAPKGVLLAGLAVLALWQPRMFADTVQFVGLGMVQVAPLVIPGILLAAWTMASGAGGWIATAFRGHVARTVLAASLVGAVLPVCGVTVLPLMAGLLAAGVPLAPVMAFWLASPVTDPAMLAATAATLGWAYALAKLVAAMGLGLIGGAVTAALSGRAWTRDPLRRNRWVGAMGAGCATEAGFQARIWQSGTRRAVFWRECRAISRLILLVLTPAFAAEFLLNAWLQPDAVAGIVGREQAWAVPLAVIVGGPAYLDGYAALPLTRALLDHGMSPGAALAFLVSGGVVSVWGALAIFPVLRLAPFLLYLALALSGSMAAGWMFGAVMAL